MIVEVPLLPCTTETEPGEADRLKLGLDELPARALIRPEPFGLPEAGGQIVAGGGRKAVAAAGDVVEIGAVARAGSDRIDERVDEADRFAGAGDCLLIDQRHIAGPHGSRKAGPAVLVGGAGGLVGADVEREISVGRNVRAVAKSFGTTRAASSRGRLPRGNRDNGQAKRRRHRQPKRFPSSTRRPRCR